MKPDRYSEFASYIVMAGNSNMSSGYEAFLRYKLVVPFLHNGTIYKKRITSNDARKLLDGFFSNRCADVYQLKLVANQLKIRI